MKKVLVIQQKMIGDVLTSTVLCEALKKHDYEVHYLINSHTLPVVLNNPFIDKTVLFTPEIEKRKRLFFKLIKTIRNERYDVIVDAYSKIGSAIITGFSKAKIRISYHKSYTSFLYSHTLKPKKHTETDEGLAIYNRVLLLKPIVTTKNTKPPKPQLFLTSEEKQNAKNLLLTSGINFNRPIFMISILGSSIIKTYPLEYMARLLDFVVELKPEAQLLFNYIPNQIEMVKEVLRLCAPNTQRAVYSNLYGKSLREFISLTSYCDALIGNEGGAVNMAKALDVPTFSIFSPWIVKSAWNSFEAYGKNVSVHLEDFSPHLYTAIHPKKYKKDALKMYEKLIPEFIKPRLENFLKAL